MPAIMTETATSPVLLSQGRPTDNFASFIAVRRRLETQSGLTMRQTRTLFSLIVLLTAALETGCVVATPVPPAPAPVVEVASPAPFPGAVWVSGVWAWHPGHRHWEWHHGHWRH